MRTFGAVPLGPRGPRPSSTRRPSSGAQRVRARTQGPNREVGSSGSWPRLCRLLAMKVLVGSLQQPATRESRRTLDSV